MKYYIGVNSDNSAVLATVPIIRDYDKGIWVPALSSVKPSDFMTIGKKLAEYLTACRAEVWEDDAVVLDY